MKKQLLIPIVTMILFACKNEKPKKESSSREVKQYSIEQFYKSSNLAEALFSSDDAKLL